MQVAVKRLHTSSAPSAAEGAFLEEVQMLQLASASCQRVCRMLGCCKLDGDACIVMSLYPKSAAKRLEESQGSLIGFAPGIRVHTDWPWWYLHNMNYAHIQHDVVAP